MSEFWKATRVDGSSFGSPDVVWRVGRVVRDPLPAGDELCGAGLLHAATVATESLVSHAGGPLWPARLFVVSPRGPVVTGDCKAGCRAWKVLREEPAHLAFGPQGQEVVALIERCSTLTDDECDALSAARYAAGAAGAAARYAARSAARSAAWAARYAVRDAAEALVVRDLISAEDFELLYGPWASVMSGPDR
jgi:hypothetical protein